MPDKITIILVDDHQLIRDGIKSLLADDNEIEVIGEASDCDELYAKLKNKQPDILLMDISLPCKSGIEITKELTETHPEIKVIILSMYNDEDFIINSLKAGAKGYLPKNTNKSEIRDAIKSIYRGEEYFNEKVSKVILKNFVRNASKPEGDRIGNQLTQREVEVLKLYAEGKTNQEIADQLFISIRTVESHKNHVMQKLNLKSNVDLIKFAIKNKMVEL